MALQGLERQRGGGVARDVDERLDEEERADRDDDRERTPSC